MQQPDARPRQSSGNGGDFAQERRSRPPQPPPGERIGQPGEQAAQGQPAQAGVAQSQGLLAPAPGMGRQPFLTQIDLWDIFHRSE